MALTLYISDVQALAPPAAHPEGPVPQVLFDTMKWHSGPRHVRPIGANQSTFYRAEDSDETFVFLLNRQIGLLADRPAFGWLAADRVWWAEDINQLYVWED